MHADESVEDAVRTAARLECAHVPRLEEEAPSDAEDDARVPSQPQLFSEPLGSKNTKAPSLLGSEDTRAPSPLPLEVPDTVLYSIFRSEPDQEVSGAVEDGRQARHSPHAAFEDVNMELQYQKRRQHTGWTMRDPLSSGFSNVIVAENSSPNPLHHPQECKGQQIVSGTIRTMHLPGQQ